ncbi:aminotransferase [Metabacillus litoralis]|jgi:aminotransferase|uniref:aminotransferase n=1 Tax=Metabacillus litoralis TaxID=152268 RepID=UPI00203B98B3|nr:aminotransferase [Metabacillus litoralis]MCM3652492.1 aminotransferase [Metabacillus litoralis]
MKSYLSSRAEQIKPSGIRRFFDMANSVEGVISLGVGEPDFITHWSICEASIKSLERGNTSYTDDAGLMELRREIAFYMQSRFQVAYTPESEIIVTVGGSQALDLSLRAILNPGDEVLIIEPSYLAYAPLVTLAGGIPVPVKTTLETNFKPKPEQIQQAIHSNTKAIILCSPNNPTGSFLNKEELEGISKIIIEHDLLVITDEIYAELTYDESFCSIASIAGMRERTIIISGFSKAFAMTGWRLGYICAPEGFSQQILKIHQNTMLCAPSVAQYGAIEALRNGHQQVEEMRNSYRNRRNFVVKSLNEMGLDCHLPGGAFYVFPSIRSTGLTSEQFAESLLLQEKVAVVPGSVFGEGGEGHVRCSYASSMDALREAMRRMEKFVKNVQLVSS